MSILLFLLWAIIKKLCTKSVKKQNNILVFLPRWQKDKKYVMFAHLSSEMAFPFAKHLAFRRRQVPFPPLMYFVAHPIR